MGKNCFNDYDSQWLNQNPTSVLPWRVLLKISDEDLRHQITPENPAPRDWSWLKISDEDIRQQNLPLVSIWETSGPRSARNFDHWIPKKNTLQNNLSDTSLVAQNTSQMRTSRILAISDDDLRHHMTPENSAPQDWSWLKISDEDLR
jgi:hypothetical protein